MPALSLVAVRAGAPAGHVALSRAQVAPADGPPVAVLALGPVGMLGLDCPYPAAPEHWMAYRLPAYDPALRGAFRYAPAFDRAG